MIVDNSHTHTLDGVFLLEAFSIMSAGFDLQLLL